MVYEKKLSGDPDYDDKVPPAEHFGIQEAPDGTKYRTAPGQGPTTLDGQHFNLDDHQKDAAASGDNRPKPGDVATEASTVQTYDPADAPHVDVEPEEVQEPEVPATPDETPASTPGPSRGAPAAKKATARK